MTKQYELLDEAKAASGAATGAETVRVGLQALVRRAAYERLQALRGTELTRKIFSDAGKNQIQDVKLPNG